MSEAPVRPEQRAYADILAVGARIGFVLVLAAFVLYASGLLPRHLPIEELRRHWHRPAREFISAAQAPRGWAWTSRLRESDYLGHVGMVWFAAMTTLGYLRILPLLARRRDWIYVGIALAEIAVLLLSASGLARVAE